MKKQSTLFPENEVTVTPELDLKEAERLVAQVKAAVGSLCERIEVLEALDDRKTRCMT